MMRAFILFALMLAASSCLTACDHATEGDKIAFAKVERAWGAKYEFHLSSDIYWSAKIRHGGGVDEEELRTIFDQFSGTRKNTVFVYMNVYDATGKFMFQLSRREDGGIAKEIKAEHY